MTDQSPIAADQADGPSPDLNMQGSGAAVTDTPAQSTKATKAPTIDAAARFLRRAEMFALCGGVLVVGIQVLVILAALTANHLRENTSAAPTHVAPAGSVVSAAQAGGLRDRGVVETDAGYYFLTSPLSVQKHEALTLETRSDGSRYLCGAEHHCAKLISSTL